MKRKSTSEGIPVVAEAVPIFPPRPDAFVTFLTSDDFLPGAMTLLYSIKKSMQKKDQSDYHYPPELVCLVTPNISQKTRKMLCPTFCTRIIEVQSLDFPDQSIQNKQIVANHVTSWSFQGALTKLHIFRLEQYDTILYIDADCLVVKDVTHLFDLGKLYQESEALLAAAPDIFPPDRFNAGVMVVRPSRSVFKNMMDQSALLSSYDGGDTGFLNAYFSEWHSNMPPFSRLKFGYNAQRFLYHSTYEKQPNYWDLGVAPDLYIVHYSSSPKPWESKPTVIEEEGKVNIEEHLQQEEIKTLKKVKKSAELELLWWNSYQRSQNYAKTYANEKMEEEKKENQAILAAKKAAQPKSVKDIHRLVSSRYKELRRQGLNTKDAMEQARQEHDQDLENRSAGSQVAAMFGINS